MTNPQDNPKTPPQPTPFDSSTPPPPSTTPKPRLRRVKMLARKTVASGDLSKKLNEKLNESPVQDSESNSNFESYKSSSEGEGHGSFDFEKAQESPSKVSSSLIENLENRFVLVGPIRDVELPEVRRSGGKKKSEKEKESEGDCGDERGKGKVVVDHSPAADLSVAAICGVVQENVEESGKKLVGSGSGKAVKGLVNLSAQGDEPGSSTEETLADLLKKVGASYNPKKRRTSTQKAPSSPKPSRKRKAYSPTPTETSLPKERATRSREKVTTVKVQTPKLKKSKTASKKSSSVSEATEPSLAKRTRSAVKSKQVRVSEDEEWSEEEEDESDGEQDKLAKFGKRKSLKGRLLKDLVEPGMMRLVDALAAQGWKDMVLQMD
ncbi:uncharacterized protein [Nicotiana sylvestris]|uniref:uncharacterized protein n=1 Tax=Nicotiana sylvestris TaxID=4096 RepID=UPI00388C93D1